MFPGKRQLRTSNTFIYMLLVKNTLLINQTAFRQVLFTLIPIGNAIALGLMLGFLYKQKSFTWWSIKTVILLTLLFFQLLMLVNFGFAKLTSPFRLILQTFEEFVRIAIFFQVAFYFLKKASKLLNNKARWASILNWMIGVVLFLYVATEVYSVTAIVKFNLNDFNVCNRLPVLIFQIDETLVILFFFILAYFISRRI